MGKNDHDFRHFIPINIKNKQHIQNQYIFLIVMDV
jgi:hypothetical protein